MSPIHDESKPLPKGPPGEKKFSTYLPLFRKGRKESGSSQQEEVKQGRGFRTSRTFSKMTRWEAFSGEPTAGDTAKSPSILGQTSFQPGHRQTSSSSGLLGWGKEQFQPKKKLAEARSWISKEPKHDKTPSQSVQELGIGPGGQSSDSVGNKQRMDLPFRPAASKSSVQLAEQETARASTPPVIPSSVVATVTTDPEEPTEETEAEEPKTEAGMTEQPKAEPKAEVKTPENQKPKVPERPTPASRHHYRTNSQKQRAISQKAINPSHGDSQAHRLENAYTDLSLDNQPGSRFSATTYDPTERGSVTESPRDSAVLNQSTDNAPSIMSRRRPVPSGMVSGRKPVRKPTPSNASEATPPAESTPNNTAESRIASLEERRATLVRRKTNIDTIVHELTQVIQPSSLAYDAAARDEVNKSVSSLRAELEDIKREEHEIGFKLFRAYKKRDQRDVYSGGSTSLWVKRVTS